MSDSISATPNSTAIPGFMIPVAAFADYWAVEEELERRHMASAGASAVGLPDGIATKIITAAVDNVASGRFKYDRPEFRGHVWTTGMVPFLLYVLIRNTTKDMTQDKAAALIKGDADGSIRKAVLTQFGYGWLFEAPKTTTPPPGNAVAAPEGSLGETSSRPSEAATGT